MQTSKTKPMVKNIRKNSLNYKITFNTDIYQGNEKIPFQERHTIYKTLLKLEFEDAIRNYMNLRDKR